MIDAADPFRGPKEPQAPLMPLRAAHKTKAPGFAGGYLLADSPLTSKRVVRVLSSKY